MVKNCTVSLSKICPLEFVLGASFLLKLYNSVHAWSHFEIHLTVRGLGFQPSRVNRIKPLFKLALQQPSCKFSMHYNALQSGKGRVVESDSAKSLSNELNSCTDPWLPKHGPYREIYQFKFALSIHDSQAWNCIMLSRHWVILKCVSAIRGLGFQPSWAQGITPLFERALRQPSWKSSSYYNALQSSKGR